MGKKIKHNLVPFCNYAIDFNRNLEKLLSQHKVRLPNNYRIVNPFTTSAACEISETFYSRYYNDQNQRIIILGINPGRHGAGLTGVPFTDGKTLESHLNISTHGIRSYEPSAKFIYQVILRLGGVEAFYKKFFFQSPFPLCLLQKNNKGNWCNANYYDSQTITKILTPIIEESLEYYTRSMPLCKTIAFCLGIGKNSKYLQSWNLKTKVFDQIIPLPHPRYIIQYRSKENHQYLDLFYKRLKFS